MRSLERSWVLFLMWLASLVATLAVGAVFGGLALNKENLLEDKCNGTVCTPAEQELEKTRDRYAVANVVLLATGGVIAAGGLALILVTKLKKEKPKVALLPTAGGLAITGSFQ